MDGRRTGSGLFVSERWADRYAADHGWSRPMRTELYKPTLGDRPIVDEPRRRLVDQSSLIGELAE